MLPKFELAPILIYFMILHEDFAPFDDTLLKDQQAFFQQDDVGQFLGDIDGGVDRDPDVRGFESRTVVDAVAKKADHAAFEMQSLDNSLLLRRRRVSRIPSCDATVSASSSSLIASICVAENDATRPRRLTSRQILRVTTSLSPVRILTFTPCLRESGNRLTSAVLGRVKKRDVAQERQIALVRNGIDNLRRLSNSLYATPTTRNPSSLSSRPSSRFAVVKVRPASKRPQSVHRFHNAWRLKTPPPTAPLQTEQ